MSDAVQKQAPTPTDHNDVVTCGLCGDISEDAANAFLLGKVHVEGTETIDGALWINHITKEELHRCGSLALAEDSR